MAIMASYEYLTDLFLVILQVIALEEFFLLECAWSYSVWCEEVVISKNKVTTHNAITHIETINMNPRIVKE